MSLEEQRSWMYSGWNEQGHHSEEWVRNTTAFLDHAFQIMPNADRFGVKCPCTNCCNGVRQKKSQSAPLSVCVILVMCSVDLLMHFNSVLQDGNFAPPPPGVILY